jgi:hypothetical protein
LHRCPKLPHSILDTCSDSDTGRSSASQSAHE